MDYIHYLTTKYKNKGIIIDTNILILFLIGSYNKNCISKFKKTMQYTPYDFDILIKLLKYLKPITTPNILTEATNHCDSFNSSTGYKFYPFISNLIDAKKELYVESKSVTNDSSFIKLGLTDSVINSLSVKGYLVLTDDLPLFGYLTTTGKEAINFNHIRSEYLLK